MPPETVTETEIALWCARYLARTLEAPPPEITPEMSFARLGLDSASSVHMIVELEDWLGVELTPETIFEHPTIAELARHLAGLAAAGGGPAPDGGSR